MAKKKAKKKTAKKAAVKKVAQPETPQSVWVQKKQAFLKGREKFKRDYMKAVDAG